MITKQITPALPSGCRSVGFLYDAQDQRELGEDMLDVALPNGLLIIAGWYPEGDGSGCYRVSLVRDYDEVAPPRETTSIDEAAKFVETFARDYGGPTFPPIFRADAIDPHSGPTRIAE